MNADADLLFHSRKRHLPAADPHHHFHGPQRKRRFFPRAFPSRFFAPLPLPPEARSAAFDMGNFLSSLPGCMPRDGGLGLFRNWVGARASQDARDLTVVTKDDLELRHVSMSRRVVDSRKVALQAAAPPREKTKPYYKEAHERTRLHDKRLGEIGVEVRLQDEKIDELRKSPKEGLSQLFIPLTAEEDNEVHHCLYGSGSSSKVLVLHESSNIEISREKFWCLRPHGWLNDEVINLYLELLKERGIREPKRFLKCHFFNTFFYKKLACGKNGYDYKSVKRWTSCRKLGYELIECDKVKWMLHSLIFLLLPVPPFLFDMLFLMFNLCSEFTLQIFVPVHKDLHWCLAIINMKENTLQYLDSLGGKDRHVPNVLARYIVEEVKDKSNKEIDISSWKEELVDHIPSQQNGWDCGMFMLKYIDFHSRGLSLSFSQEHMEYFRKRTVKEILRLRAD